MKKSDLTLRERVQKDIWDYAQNAPKFNTVVTNHADTGTITSTTTGYVHVGEGSSGVAYDANALGLTT